jgi:hypothetical protein
MQFNNFHCADDAKEPRTLLVFNLEKPFDSAPLPLMRDRGIAQGLFIPDQCPS